MPDSEASRLAVAERELANLWVAIRAFANVPLDLGLARHDIDDLKSKVERLDKRLEEWRQEMTQRDEVRVRDQARRDEVEQEREEARRQYEKQQRDDMIRFRITAATGVFVAFLMLLGTILATSSGI